MNKLSTNKIISILGIVGLILLGGSLALYLVQNIFPLWMKISMSAGAVLCLVFVGFNWEQIQKSILSKQSLRGTNTTVFIIIVLAILVLVNYLGTRHHKRFDITKNKTFTLSEQTIKLIGQIKEPLEIHAFYRMGGENGNQFYTNVRNLLQEYTSLSNKIKVQYVDPDINPGLTEEYHAKDGNSILEYQGRKETVTGFDEQDFSTGILKLLNKEKKKIYFLTGHGEVDIDDSDKLGLSEIKSALERENHIVSKLAITTQTSIPPDISVLVIAGPKTELFPYEVQALDKYLKAGGKVLVMLNPPASKTASSANLSNLLTPYGIHADDDVVLDVQSYGDLLTPAIRDYSYNDITHGLSATIFPYSRSLSLDTGLPITVTSDKFLESSENSWGKVDLNSKSPQFNPEKDKKGPLTLGITYDAKASVTTSQDTTLPIPDTRMVVIGNVNFAANAVIQLGGNRDLILNSINWLTGDTDLLGIRAKEPETHEMTLVGYQGRLIAFTSLLFIPGLILLAGIIVWIRRRG